MITMRHRLAVAFGAAALTFTGVAVHAGPCTDEIYQADEAINRRLDAIAGRGKTAAESTFATMHRQPTPATIAGAEEKAGDISAEDAKQVREYMTEARKADEANDRPACEKALTEARKILGM